MPACPLCFGAPVPLIVNQLLSLLWDSRRASTLCTPLYRSPPSASTFVLSSSPSMYIRAHPLSHTTLLAPLLSSCFFLVFMPLHDFVVTVFPLLSPCLALRRCYRVLLAKSQHVTLAFPLWGYRSGTGPSHFATHGVSSPPEWWQTPLSELLFHISFFPPYPCCVQF